MRGAIKALATFLLPQTGHSTVLRESWRSQVVAVLEPGFEFVVLAAAELVENHGCVR
jgi:hypothetical protein